jgi:hypothetical protein
VNVDVILENIVLYKTKADNDDNGANGGKFPPTDDDDHDDDVCMYE